METESADQSKKIFVKMMKTIAVNVKDTDTIDAVKTKIQEVEGLPLSQQELFFAETHLKGTETLGYYDVPANSCLDLYVMDGIAISVKTLTKSFSLHVKRSDTVLNVKAMIHDKEGIPSDQQVLIFSHNMLDDDRILASCGVHNNSVLQMLTRPVSGSMNVTVKLTQGSAINIEVQNWYTIAEVKLIAGIPQDRGYKLFCSYQELQDDKTLRHYKIKDNDVLAFKPELIQIFVMGFDRKSIVMMVDEYEKVSDVADRIGKKLNLDPRSLEVLYRGRRLIDASMLGENNIANESVLHLRMSCRK